MKMMKKYLKVLMKKIEIITTIFIKHYKNIATKYQKSQR